MCLFFRKGSTMRRNVVAMMAVVVVCMTTQADAKKKPKKEKTHGKNAVVQPTEEEVVLFSQLNTLVADIPDEQATEDEWAIWEAEFEILSAELTQLFGSWQAWVDAMEAWLAARPDEPAPDPDPEPDPDPDPEPDPD